MKLFLDTADVQEIREANSWGILDGVTTNPSLIAKTGRSFKEVVKEITTIVDGPISAETISEDAKGMIAEAKDLAKIHKNIYVKVPMSIEGLKAVKECTKLGIKTNVTLVFTPNQALLAAKAGATFVSPFIGRLDDISHEGMDIIAEIVVIFSNYDYPTQVLVASVRHPNHVKEAAMLGAGICTLPFNVLQKMVQHPLTDKGIATFLADYKKIPKK
ncbi:fructose-6-phosphate aldolase [Candidatus Woesearchaeota archaeon]|nr:fructose-6-phosphate aldolase [Candidatus Woesearchaeota archaeon]